MSDWSVAPHPVPPELEPGFVHALPPDHHPDLDLLDEDRHPTSAWLAVGERIDPEILRQLRFLRDNPDQA